MQRPIQDETSSLEQICFENSLENGDKIVCDFRFGKKRYGIVVKNGSGGRDVIYRRRIAFKGPVKTSYSKFTKGAIKTAEWEPPEEKLRKQFDNLVLFPNADVAERALAALEHGIVISSPIGDVGSCIPEDFLLRISIQSLDWRLTESIVLYKNVLVHIYQPHKELKPGDIVFAGRPFAGGAGTYYHAGVVHSISDEGEVFVGHFGPDKNLKKKEYNPGCPKLTTFDQFMRQSDGKAAKGIYRVEYLRDGSTHDVREIQERIEKSVRGQLLPTGVNAKSAEENITDKLRDISRIVTLPQKTRKVPCYHLANWNCEDWAFWIARGKESSEEETLSMISVDESAKKEPCDAGKKTGDEKASSAQGTQGTDIVVSVGQVLDKSLPVTSAVWGVAEDVAPVVAKTMGKNIARGCGKALGTLGPAAGRATFGAGAVGVSAAIELTGLGINYAVIARKAKNGKITEAEKNLLIDRMASTQQLKLE